MKKARIILSAVALLAVVGGALAFKARQTFGQVFTLTDEYVSGSHTYTAAALFYAPSTPARYFNTTAPIGQQPVANLYSTTGTTSPGTITLTADDGSGLTITLPKWTVSLTTTFTSAVN